MAYGLPQYIYDQCAVMACHGNPVAPYTRNFLSDEEHAELARQAAPFLLLMANGIPGDEILAFGAAARGGLVIGRGADLAKPGALRAGEYSLRWESKLPNFKAEWHENAGRLREVMRQGNPIRDISPGDTGGIFLNAERALLRDRGWTFNSQTGYWIPPAP